MESIRVFIVEDDPMVASINKRFTETMVPFKVVGMCNNENEALQQIKETLPDFILLDIYLTHGNGLNILKRIRQENIPSDIILVTAAKDSSTIHEALRYGAVDYLIKPFDIERLQQALLNGLRLRRLLSQKPNLSQDDLDGLNGPLKITSESEALISSNSQSKTVREFTLSISTNSLPKGVHQLTLDQIYNFILTKNKFLTCQVIASELAMSKITVWRYLEYLVEIGKVRAELEYGTIGRPTKIYCIK